MTETKVSISIMVKLANAVKVYVKNFPKTALFTTLLHVHILGSGDMIVSPW